MAEKFHSDFQAATEVGQELHDYKEEAAKATGVPYGEMRTTPAQEASLLMRDGEALRKYLGPDDAGRVQRLRKMLALMREHQKQ